MSLIWPLRVHSECDACRLCFIGLENKGERDDDLVYSMKFAIVYTVTNVRGGYNTQVILVQLSFDAYGFDDEAHLISG